MTKDEYKEIQDWFSKYMSVFAILGTMKNKFQDEEIQETLSSIGPDIQLVDIVSDFLNSKKSDMDNELKDEYKEIDKVLSDINDILFGANANYQGDPSELPEEYRVDTTFNGMGWTQVLYKFPNGYGASIIRYGDEWELAVLDQNGYLTYETPVTNDVIRGDAEFMRQILETIRKFES